MEMVAFQWAEPSTSPGDRRLAFLDFVGHRSCGGRERRLVSPLKTRLRIALPDGAVPTEVVLQLRLGGRAPELALRYAEGGGAVRSTAPTRADRFESEVARAYELLAVWSALDTGLEADGLEVVLEGSDGGLAVEAVRVHTLR